MSPGETTYQVLSVIKALNVLEAFAEREGESLSLAELTEIIGEHKAVTHRLVMTLHKQGFLDRDPVSKRFSIGPRMFVLGSQYKRHQELEQVVVPLLRELAREHGHSGYVAVLDGNECLITDTVEGWHPVRTSAKAGQRRPLFATALGKALLSEFDAREARLVLERTKMISYTKHTVLDIDTLLQEVEEARTRGYAICRQEMWDGISAVGVPIRMPYGQVLAGASVSFPSSMLSDEQIEQLARAMCAMAESAAQALKALVAARRAQ